MTSSQNIGGRPCAFAAPRERVPKRFNLEQASKNQITKSLRPPSRRCERFSTQVLYMNQSANDRNSCFAPGMQGKTQYPYLRRSQSAYTFFSPIPQPLTPSPTPLTPNPSPIVVPERTLTFKCKSSKNKTKPKKTSAPTRPASTEPNPTAPLPPKENLNPLVTLSNMATPPN